MVFFSCDYCQTCIKKPKVSQHIQQCGTGSLSCVDCGVTFDTNSVHGHTSCMTESERYMGKLYKGPKAGNGAGGKQSTLVDPSSLKGPPWKCDICNLKATGAEHLATHMNGKKHQAKARRIAAEKEAAANGGANADSADKKENEKKREREEKTDKEEKKQKTESGDESSKKWRRLIQKTVMDAPDQEMKVKKLRKAVLAHFSDSDVSKCELKEKFEEKLKKCKKLKVEGKIVRAKE